MVWVGVCRGGSISCRCVDFGLFLIGKGKSFGLVWGGAIC